MGLNRRFPSAVPGTFRAPEELWCSDWEGADASFPLPGLWSRTDLSLPALSASTRRCEATAMELWDQRCSVSLDNRERKCRRAFAFYLPLSCGAAGRQRVSRRCADSPTFPCAWDISAAQSKCSLGFLRPGDLSLPGQHIRTASLSKNPSWPDACCCGGVSAIMSANSVGSKWRFDFNWHQRNKGKQ